MGKDSKGARQGSEDLAVLTEGGSTGCKARKKEGPRSPTWRSAGHMTLLEAGQPHPLFSDSKINLVTTIKY